MNRSIYTKLAISNLKNNRKSYIPYVLTAILTVMMYYMMANLAANSPMNQEALQIILSLSVHVIEIFALIFLFYTNSFLIKRNRSVSHSRNGETAACENAGDRDGCNRCGQYSGWNLFRNCACKADVCTSEKNDSL